MKVTNLYVFLALCLWLGEEVTVKAQRLEGEFCRRSYDNSPGICTVATRCPQLTVDYRQSRIVPEICSYTADETLVCCPSDRQFQTRKTTKRTLTTSSSSFTVGKRTQSNVIRDETPARSLSSIDYDLNRREDPSKSSIDYEQKARPSLGNVNRPTEVDFSSPGRREVDFSRPSGSGNAIGGNRRTENEPNSRPVSSISSTNFDEGRNVVNSNQNFGISSGTVVDYYDQRAQRPSNANSGSASLNFASGIDYYDQRTQTTRRTSNSANRGVSNSANSNSNLSQGGVSAVEYYNNQRPQTSSRPSISSTNFDRSQTSAGVDFYDQRSQTTRRPAVNSVNFNSNRPSIVSSDSDRSNSRIPSSNVDYYEPTTSRRAPKQEENVIFFDQNQRTTTKRPAGHPYYDDPLFNPITTSRRTTPRTTTRDPLIDYWERATERTTTRRTTTRKSWNSGNDFFSDLDRDYGSNSRITTRPTTSRPRHRKSDLNRISVQKCAEYKKHSVKKVGFSPLVINPTVIELEVYQCDATVPLIVGGARAKPGEFPHMAAIGWRKYRDMEWKCGGSLISERYVLTAAHCAKSDGHEPNVVRLGEQNLHRSSDGATPDDFGIDEIIIHPDYSSASHYDDIALIKLDRSVDFSRMIRPACLWTTDQINQTSATATGWGAVGFVERSSDELLKVELDLLDNRDCSRYMERNRRLNEGIVGSQLCAGVLSGTKDTCHGDSGGPLQLTLPDNQCVYFVVGITSFGKYCGGINSPGVYTRVSSYIDWIESIVW